MAKIRILVLITGLLSCLPTHSALACRYNVRETGFVDLGIESYYLFGFVGADTPADITSSFKEISYAALMDSNIKVEMIDTNDQKGHPAMKLLDSKPRQSLPCAVLLSPDGQSLAVPITEPGKPFKDTLWAAMEKILSSAQRKEILRKVAKAYGIVLLIEGANPQENKKAKDAAAAAIELVSSQLEMIPKPIKYPPELVVMKSKAFSREDILLWSFGIEDKEPNEPYAAVLYGRARWIGPLFKGPEITEDNLARVLFVVGGDCECGIDYRWLQGTMLPAKWGRNLNKIAVDSLGFDPESPMIKMEISSIIGRGLGPYYYGGGPFGYQELIVESDSNDVEPYNVDSNAAEPNANKLEIVDSNAAEPNISEPDTIIPKAVIERLAPNQVTTIAAPEPNTVQPSASKPAKVQSTLRYTILVLVILTALVIIFGAAILIRANRR